MEIEHALVRRVEELAEEFADVPLIVIVRLVYAQVDKSHRDDSMTGHLVNVDPDAIADAVRRELLKQRLARSIADDSAARTPRG